MPRPGRVTLRDVAAALGVSPMTVSLGLRNHPHVARTTAARVQAKAHELGYRPDPEVARVMSRVRAGRSPSYRGTLAFLNAWPEQDRVERESYVGGLWQGARQRAQLLGYKLDLFWLGDPGLRPNRMAAIVRARGIDGLLIPPLPDPGVLRHFEWSRLSVVALTERLRASGFPTVAPDNSAAAVLALEHVLARGYRRPGLVWPRFYDESTLGSTSARFLRWQHEQAPDRRVPWLGGEPDEAAFRAWFGVHRPDVILFPHSDQFRAWWRAIEEPRITPPAYVTLDWSPLRPSFAGVDKQPPVIGSAGVDLLVTAIQQNEQGLPPHPKTVLIQPQWVDGLSCPPSRRRGPVLRRMLSEIAP